MPSPRSVWERIDLGRVMSHNSGFWDLFAARIRGLNRGLALPQKSSDGGGIDEIVIDVAVRWAVQCFKVREQILYRQHRGLV